MAMRAVGGLIVLAALAAALTGAAPQAPQDPPKFDSPDYGAWLPKNYNAAGGDIDRLFYLILCITGFFFILVEGGILVFLVAFRHREGRKAVYTHGHRGMEIVWTLVPAVILVWLALYQRDVWARQKINFPKEDDPNTTLVEVTAEQFQWTFRYPGPDRKFGRTRLELADPQSNPLGIDWKDPDAADDVWSVGALHVPVDKPVLAYLRSKDVIHSFFVPVMRVKQDVVPGLDRNRAWFHPTTACERKTALKSDGTPKPSYMDDITSWEVACAELCGANHYSMRGQLIVESQEHFDEWTAYRRQFMGEDD